METECFSIYSVMSNRIIASSLLNKSSANALASSVFPTPVGPRNRNTPRGRCGSLNPTRAARIESLTAAIAKGCPTTLSSKDSSNTNNFSDSPSNIFCTGIPVQFATTCAINRSSTSS
ncbi:Uncharacterised protein [Chlamydia trachomatis]|nr:Uncharacterised protein [Chlamydia trachomatis]